MQRRKSLDTATVHGGVTMCGGSGLCSLNNVGAGRETKRKGSALSLSALCPARALFFLFCVCRSAKNAERYVWELQMVGRLVGARFAPSEFQTAMLIYTTRSLAIVPEPNEARRKPLRDPAGPVLG